MVSFARQHVQTKGGVVAAFGLARGLGGVDVSVASAPLLSVDVLGPAALFAGQSMLSAAFAALALDYALAAGWVAPRSGAPREPPL